MIKTQTNAVRGFTLIETVIVIALFVIMLLALFNFYISYTTTHAYQTAFVETASSAGTIVNEVTHAVLPASQVLSGHSFSGTPHFTSETSLVLEVPAIDSSGFAIPGTYDYIGFYVDGTRVYRVIDADNASERLDGTKLLSDSLRSLSFSYSTTTLAAVESVEVDVETERSLKGSFIEHHLTQEIYLRNNASI